MFELGTIFIQSSDTNSCLRVYTKLLRDTYDDEELFKSDFEELDNSLNINLTNLTRKDVFISESENILTKFASSLKEKPMRELITFLRIKLNATDLKKLLVQENIFRLPVLFISAINTTILLR